MKRPASARHLFFHLCQALVASHGEVRIAMVPILRIAQHRDRPRGHRAGLDSVFRRGKILNALERHEISGLAPGRSKDSTDDRRARDSRATRTRRGLLGFERAVQDEQPRRLGGVERVGAVGEGSW